MIPFQNTSTCKDSNHTKASTPLCQMTCNRTDAKVQQNFSFAEPDIPAVE